MAHILFFRCLSLTAYSSVHVFGLAHFHSRTTLNPTCTASSCPRWFGYIARSRPKDGAITWWLGDRCAVFVFSFLLYIFRPYKVYKSQFCHPIADTRNLHPLHLMIPNVLTFCSFCLVLPFPFFPLFPSFLNFTVTWRNFASSSVATFCSTSATSISPLPASTGTLLTNVVVDPFADVTEPSTTRPIRTATSTTKRPAPVLIMTSKWCSFLWHYFRCNFSYFLPRIFSLVYTLVVDLSSCFYLIMTIV